MSREQRFDPLKEFQNIGEQVAKQIERGIRTVTSGPEQLLLDMYQVEDQLIIRTQALDGLVKESIEISLESNLLTIALLTEAESSPTSARYFLQERRFGHMSRTLELSVPVKGNEARAKVEGGNNLIITLPLDDSIYGNITVTPVE